MSNERSLQKICLSKDLTVMEKLFLVEIKSLDNAKLDLPIGTTLNSFRDGKIYRLRAQEDLWKQARANRKYIMRSSMLLLQTSRLKVVGA